MFKDLVACHGQPEGGWEEKGDSNKIHVAASFLRDIKFDLGS